MMPNFFPLFPLILLYIFLLPVFRGIRGARRKEVSRSQSRHQLPRPEDRNGRSAQSLDSRIFRIAESQGGKLTISDVVVGTGLGVKEAEDVMDRMVDGQRIRLEIEDHSGILMYDFPEIRLRKG